MFVGMSPMSLSLYYIGTELKIQQSPIYLNLISLVVPPNKWEPIFLWLNNSSPTDTEVSHNLNQKAGSRTQLSLKV